MGLAVGLGGCATYSDKIAPSYVSPMQYESLNCNQLREEGSRVSGRAIQVMGAQDSQATRDSVVTGVSAVIFWPALFFIGGDKTTANEVARLKGEMEAIEAASVRKNCGIQFQRASQ